MCWSGGTKFSSYLPVSLYLLPVPVVHPPTAPCTDLNPLHNACRERSGLAGSKHIHKQVRHWRYKQNGVESRRMREEWGRALMHWCLILFCPFFSHSLGSAVAGILIAAEQNKSYARCLSHVEKLLAALPAAQEEVGKGMEGGEASGKDILEEGEREGREWGEWQENL